MATKSELITTIAERAGTTKATASQVLDTTLEAITHFLKAGDDVKLVGFGNFSVKSRPPRPDAILGPAPRSRSRRRNSPGSRPARDCGMP